MQVSNAQAQDSALSLPNRFPLEVDRAGRVNSQILKAYEEYGFVVLKQALGSQEIDELRSEFKELLDRAPTSADANSDMHKRPLEFNEQQRKLFRFVKPLTDPFGGTDVTYGRYPVKMPEPSIPQAAPKDVLLQIGGILQFLESALRIYANPKLLALTEAINGPDFTPFSEVIWLKQPRFGAAVSWHQDGTTHWDSPSLSSNTHGFNFMVNFFETNTENALWIVPGTHRSGKADLRKMQMNSQTSMLANAVPLICEPGDVAVCNRQVVHGSFPNTSDHPRFTYVFGFHRRSSVEGIKGWGQKPYTNQFIDRSCQTIRIAIDYRNQCLPDEESYLYEPFAKQPRKTWSVMERRSDLLNYQRWTLGI